MDKVSCLLWLLNEYIFMGISVVYFKVVDVDMFVVVLGLRGWFYWYLEVFLEWNCNNFG